jgi:hypothetical protein
VALHIAAVEDALSVTTRSVMFDPSGRMREGRVLSWPAPDTGLRLAGPAHDLIGANTVIAQQDDLSSPDMLVWGIAIHAPDSHAWSPLGIPSGIQMLDAIH